MKRFLKYFSPFEWGLWLSSLLIITVFFFVFDREGYLTLIASLIGVTSLIFAAKGNPLGPLLMVIFSVLYGIISYSFAYYGEMITYLGMTLPMSVFALISWLKNPYKGKKSEVAVNRLSKKEIIFALVLTIAVTVAFYFILDAFNTANIIPSTLSVTTSFLAVYLTWRRSPCLCHKRRDFNCFVDIGNPARPLLPIGHGLLCRLPRQRPLRFHKLVQNGEKAKINKYPPVK